MKSISLILILSMSGVAQAAARPVWTVACTTHSAEARTTKQIVADITGLTGEFGGSRETTVWVDGVAGRGFASLEQSQNSQGHGVWDITVKFGSQLTLTTAAEPVFEDAARERVVARGPGVVRDLGRRPVASLSCRVITGCRGDLRVCPE